MKYSIADVRRLPLREDLLGACITEMCKFLRVLGPVTQAGAAYEQRHLVSLTQHPAVLEDYQNSVEYLLSENNKQRAKIAFEAKVRANTNDALIAIWTEHADKMMEFEKIMAGWDKI